MYGAFHYSTGKAMGTSMLVARWSYSVVQVFEGNGVSFCLGWSSLELKGNCFSSRYGVIFILIKPP